MKSGSRVTLPLGAAPIAGYLLAFLLFPVGVLVLYSFWTSAFFDVVREFTLSNYGRIFSRGLYTGLLIKSLVVGLVVACVTIPLSFSIAYAITFRFRRWGDRILVLVMVSMLSSYIVRIYAWKAILGPNGLVNQALMTARIIDEPLAFLLYGNAALVITLTHILMPYSVLPIYSALQTIDGDVLAASRDLGASAARTFRRVTLPLAMPGVTVAFLFCFILAAADYLTPQLVGGKQGLLVGRVIADQFGPAGNYPFGGALSVALLGGFVVVIGLLGVGRFVLRRVSSFGLRTSGDARTGPPGRLSRLLSSVPWLESLTVALLLFLYLPLVVVVLFSLNSSTAGIFPLEGLTLKWYREVFSSSAFLSSLRASLIVASVAVVATLVIATPAAFALVRRNFRLRQPLVALTLSPIAIPGVVIGAALLASLAFAGIDGGLAPTAVAHVLFALPFVVLVVQARLADFDEQIEEAARDLGSSKFRTFRTVTLPIIAPSLVGAAILVFALSLDEFIITNFVVGANSTLPVLIWGQMRLGITPAVNAISTLILLGSLALVGFAALILWQRRVPVSNMASGTAESGSSESEEVSE